MVIFAPLHTGQFVIKPRARARRRMTVSLVAIVALLLPYATFEVGRMLGGYSIVRSTHQQWVQSQRVTALETEVEQLQRKLNTTQLSQTVDQHSAAGLQGTIDELQNQLQLQRTELAFYQSIVTPAAGAPNEPQVQRVEIEPTPAPTKFLLRVVLVQPMQASGQAQGTLQVEVNGMQHDSALSLPLTELTSDTQLKSLKFAYRYFQVIEQAIELPPDFVPSGVVVELHAGQRAAQRQSFNWQLQRASDSNHVQTS
jgi:hypothetical protein